MSDNYFLSVRQLTRRYDETPALSAIELGVKEDELLVVVGPTGAGKTTLLRCLCGLDTADSGSVWLDGKNVTGLSPADRDLAMVFQNFSLYPRWTVRQNLAFPLRAPGRRLSETEIDSKVQAAAEMLNITRLLARPAVRLSGGEMQRVAIGRAIVREPRAYLMDEPLTNLDAKLRESLRVELVELRRRSGRPMIYVTHDQAEALSMADRIVVLDRGHVLQTGTPTEVYERPVSPRVAVQLGQPRINLFDADLSEGKLVLEGGVHVPFTAAAQDRVASTNVDLRSSKSSSGAVVVGVRPEQIELAGGSVSGSISAVHYMGATTSLQLQWAGQTVNVSIEGSTELKEGDTVQPQIKAALVWEK